MSDSPLKGIEEMSEARLDEAGIALDFGDVAAERRALAEGAGWLDWSDRAWLRVEGPDAARFLHNMTTNDVKALAVGGGCYTVFATKKGKMIADAMLLRTGEETFELELEPRCLDSLSTMLGKYIALEKAELTDESAVSGALLIAGPKAEATLKAIGLTVPGSDYGHVEAGIEGTSVRLVRLETWTGQPTFELRCPRAEVAELATKLARNEALSPVGRTAFHAARIEAGVPWFGIDMDEERLPMEAGLETRAISYTKGCYVGQEIIARVKYKGHVNRHLVRLKIDGGGPVAPGAEVKLDGEPDAIGEITSCAPALLDGTPTVALAYLRHGHHEPGTKVQVDERDAIVG
ncbi:MAG: glycine cleavage T C-terminal barrel domain-containing protein [Planctomycetota bacterium]